MSIHQMGMVKYGQTNYIQDFLFLFLVVTFFGVLIKNGAVIILYAEASKPSFCEAVSGVLVTSGCSERACSFSQQKCFELAK